MWVHRFENPRWLLTAIGLVAVAGIAALGTIVRQEDPTITNGLALIITPFPGASAGRVESLVTEKLEEELTRIRELQIIESTSRAGVSVVSVQIDETLTGEKTVPVLSKVRDAMDDAQARFPRGAMAPIFDDERFGSYTLLLGLTARGDLSQVMLRRHAVRLEDQLRAVLGTDHVKTFGASGPRIRVRVDVTSLAASGLGPRDVAAALERADAKVASGVLRSAETNLVLEVQGELDSLARVREVPLGVSPEGALLTVGDVAEVSRDLAEPAREGALVDGKPGFIVGTQLAAGERFDVWRARVEPRLESFRAGLPENIELTTLFDQTTYTRARLSDLGVNLVTGLALVVAVLFVTLGLRPALIVSGALPFVVLASVAVLRWMGIPIHQMSVAGLIVALGLLVDNAIVMTDAVQAKLRIGMERHRAVAASVRQLAVPLFASTLTTVLAFMPIILLPGRVGEFVGTIGTSVVVTLIVSYVLAMTVVAAAAGRFSLGREGARSKGGFGAVLGRGFERTLGWSTRNPWWSAGLAAFIPLLGFAVAGSLPRQFFPPADRDQMHVQLRLPPSASIDATRAAVERVEGLLRERPEVVGVSWTLGRSVPPVYYNMLQNQDGNPAFAEAVVKVKRISDVGAIFEPLQRRVDELVPGAQVVLREILQGPPVPAPIEYRVFGPELSELRRIGEALRERMSRVPVVTHTTASLTASTPKLRLGLDEGELLLAGLRPVEVAGQLQLLLEGVEGGSVLEGAEELPVRVRASEATRNDIDTLLGLSVLSPRRPELGSPGAGIPLGALVTPELVPVLDGIPHRNGERVNVARGFTLAGVYPEAALTAFRAELEADPIDIPPGYRLEVGGDAEKQADALGDLFASMPVLVILMIASVALSLNSFRMAGAIFFVAVTAMGFGLLSVAALGFPLGFQSIIGLIGLMGVAVNAGIVITSALQMDPAAVAGNADRVRDIVYHDTSRHIISTTVTTFGGFLPLLLTEGGFWPPFAAVIAGGTLLSAIGSFYFIPPVFLLLTRRRPITAEEVTP